MAVTARWIEEQADDTLDGPRKKLILCSALIGFHVVPKGHDRKRLAQVLFSVIEQVQILGQVSKYHKCMVTACDNIIVQIGWVTVDNVSNNTTMMSVFGLLLRACGIKFDYLKCHIQSDISYLDQN
jgi:hypothetical protein